MSEKLKMINGEYYNAGDSELVNERKNCRILLDEINQTTCGDDVLCKVNKLIKSADENAFIQPPFYCDYGYNIYVGKDFYFNFNCVFLDVAPIKIGDNCMFGPDVKLYTATHPLASDLRNSGLELGKAITIKDNVWIGGSVVVYPGVEIGNNVVVSAGSVVTKSIPDNVLVAGNPAIIVKKIK